jgi:hypothetical protein
VDELAHPEPGFYAIGMKSYGRAPTFLMATGYEQARSVVAALAGDWTAARDVQLDLPETGVCSSTMPVDSDRIDSSTSGGCCGTPAAATAVPAGRGPMAGAEVVQVYLGVPVQGQPPKRLVGFQKVFLKPGESKPVTITLDPAATNHPFGVWDYCTHDVATKPGEYTVYVGNAADNTPHTATVTVG